jgi:hypothetical protein
MEDERSDRALLKAARSEPQAFGEGLAASRVRIEVFQADGSPILDDSSATTGSGTETGRVVDYSQRAWFATTERTPVPPACGMVCEIRQDPHTVSSRSLRTPPSMADRLSSYRQRTQPQRYG